jgi:hypothetical protein
VCLKAHLRARVGGRVEGRVEGVERGKEEFACDEDKSCVSGCEGRLIRDNYPISLILPDMRSSIFPFLT